MPQSEESCRAKQIGEWWSKNKILFLKWPKWRKLILLEWNNLNLLISSKSKLVQCTNFECNFSINIHTFWFRLLERKKLFKDHDFPPNDASFSRTKARKDWKSYPDMKWMRASEISKNPKFLGGAVTRFDVNQGKLKISKNNDKY